MATKEESSIQPIGVGQKLADTCSDKMAAAHKLKDEGNGEFKSGKYRAATRKYHHALMYTRGVETQGDTPPIPGLEQLVRCVPTEDEKKAAKELALTLSNNLSACFLKTEKWEKVVEYAGKVLDGDPDNAKALFRRGTAYIHLNRPEDAQRDLTRAQTLTPENREVKRQLTLLEKKSRQLKAQEQKLYSTMLGGWH